MKIIAQFGETLSIDLSAEQVENIAYSLEDSEGNAAVFELLAQHPASGVRRAVADKEHISVEAVQLLAQDVSADVRKNVVGNRKGRECLREETLLHIIALDPEAAESIAYSVESFQEACQEKLAKALAAHTDPRVRKALAGNSSAPKRFIKQLLRDDDRGVRQAAEGSLRY